MYNPIVGKIINDNRFHEWQGKFYPRCTFILDTCWPKDKFLLEWIAKNGFNAENIKSEAGEKGRRIHQAIADLINKETIYLANFSQEEWEKILTFVSWYHETKPKILEVELSVFHKGLGVVGTLDAVAEIDGERYVLDWKSSSATHKHFFAQTAFYAAAYESMKLGKINKTAILRLGSKHKAGFEYTVRSRIEMMQDFQSFKACKKIFDYQMGEIEPVIKEIPTEIKL